MGSSHQGFFRMRHFFKTRVIERGKLLSNFQKKQKNELTCVKLVITLIFYNEKVLTYYTPIFATSLSELQFIKSDTLPHIGTDVMKVKSQIFTIPTKRNFHMLKDFFSRRNKKKQTFRNITHLEVGN